jgi:hypothetical protein
MFSTEAHSLRFEVLTALTMKITVFWGAAWKLKANQEDFLCPQAKLMVVVMMTMINM